MMDKFVLYSLGCTFLMLGCGKKDESNNAVGKVNLSFRSNVTSLALDSVKLANTAIYSDLPITTAASSNGVSTLKMYFREIKLCTSLKFNSGTGYTVDGPCATVYENTSDAYTGTEAPTASDRTKFDAAGEGKFYDVLKETERAKLNRGVSVAVGEYNYGIIETHPWVKLTAKKDTLCTKAAGAQENTAVGGDGIKTYYSSVTSLTCAETEAAEEVLMYITNANSTFKFLKPFTVNENEEVTVDLAFNLDSEVKSIANGDTVPGALRASDAQNSFYVPMIRMGAAPRKAEETTKVETYFLGASTNKERIRVQIYYNSADAAKTVLGVNSTVLATSASTKTKANVPIYTSSVTQSGDVVTFKAWDGAEVLSFTRGVAGSATINCTGNGGGQALEECADKTSLTLTYEAPVVSNL